MKIDIKLIFVELGDQIKVERSSFLNKFFLDWAWDSEVNFKNFVYKHINDFIFICFKIFFDLSNLRSCLFLKRDLEFFILFLNKKIVTLYFKAWNSVSFCCLYLLTSTYAASLASFNFLCLNHLNSTSPCGH